MQVDSSCFGKNIFRLFFLQFLLWLPAHAQSPKIDSLQQLINSEKDNQKKVSYLNQLTFIYFGHDLTKAQSTSQQALEVALKIGDKNGEAWATTYQGLLRYFEGALKEAEHSYARAAELNKRLEDSKLTSYLLIQFGNLSRNKGLFDSAFYFYRQAESFTLQTNNLHFLAITKMNLARTFLILDKPDSALVHLGVAETLWAQLKNTESIKDTWILIGNCYLGKSNLEEAERYYNKAVAGKSVSPSVKGQYLMNMGEIYFHRGDFPKALENWYQVLHLQKSLHYSYELSYLLLRIAEAYEEQGFFDLAAEYLSQSLKISEQAPFYFLMGETYYEISWVYIRTNNFNIALQNILKAEREFNRCNQPLRLAGILNVKGVILMNKKSYDSSLYYHTQSLTQREQLGNKIAISSSLHNLGELFNWRGEHQKALPYLWRGLAIDRSIHDDYGKSLYYLQLAIAYRGLQKTDSAKFYLDQTIALSIGNSAADLLQRSYAEMASHLKSANKPFEAIEYLNRSIQLRDSLYSKQGAQSLAAYQALYDVEKKEQEILSLNKDKLLKEANSKQQQFIFYVLVIGSLSLAALLLFYYRLGMRLKKSNLINEEKTEEVQTQAEELSEAIGSLHSLNDGLEKKNNELEVTLSQLQKTQGQLIQAEKMASLGMLSSGIAHELNNPLNFIKGGVTALEQQLTKPGGSTSEDVRTYIKIINEGVNRATIILKGLGNYSRQSERMDESCDLHTVIDNSLLMLRNTLKQRIKIERSFASEPVMVTGNVGKLHQAFLNIIQNAEQAIMDKGVIRISTTVSSQAKTISIADSGCGISAENLKRLGDPFFTTKAPGKGTGLGLSIAYKIIKDHGGRISVQSEIGKGTEIIVIFDK